MPVNDSGNMSQKFRIISNAVTAGRKLNDLAKNQRNVEFFMEPGGSTHIFTLTDEEKVGEVYLFVSRRFYRDFFSRINDDQ